MVFATVARRVPWSLLVPVGAAFGHVLVSAFVGLPTAVKVTGSSSVISDMVAKVA